MMENLGRTKNAVGARANKSHVFGPLVVRSDAVWTSKCHVGISRLEQYAQQSALEDASDRAEVGQGLADHMHILKHDYIHTYRHTDR